MQAALETRADNRPSSKPSIRTIAESRRAGADGLPSNAPASTYDLLRSSAEQHGESEALGFFIDVASHRSAEAMSYRQLFDSVTRTANVLHDLGVSANDVVALMLPNLPETFLAIWGSEAAGIVMPINPLLEPAAIAALLTAAGASVLITLAPFPGTDLYGKAVEVVAATPTIRNVLLVDLAHHVRGVRGLGARFLAWRAWRAAPRISRAIGVHRFASALRGVAGDRLTSRRQIASSEIASYFCTGGTTGLPKIAVRTHGQEVANAWMANAMLGDALDTKSTMLCGLPLFHVNAVIASGLATFLRGARVLLCTPQGFRAPGLLAHFWDVVAHHRVTAFSGVPTLLTSLLDHPAQGLDLPRFKYAFSGAAPLSAEVLHRFEQTCQVSVVEAYGLTETTCLSSMNPPDGEHRPGSVGLPIPAQDIRTVILDGDGMFVRDAEPEEIGVVTIAGPNVFSGYLTPEHDRGIWVDRGDSRRWLNTGDLGRIDDDGYLWLTGRAKDLIIRGGHNIDPSMIEEALHSHPDVALAAAIGRPDAYAGEVPIAYVQLRPGSTMSEDALAAYAATRIGERAAIPKSIRILDAIPLTPIGKIHKPTLRLDALEGAARAALTDAGVAKAEVTAASDARTGSVVRIKVAKADEERARAALRPFAFASEVLAIPTAQVV